ncbi:NAD-dependent epimerase/dehydratase family protein [Zavarzinella formosa]|uniref:NAD-dependent epimerase/dehydratase family protein n=1 Tax=Zavarzinella formosa TaxID=360055 RepID=UPI00030C52A2|nr:NAD-dependent epimerase/dehydratase family protein [Zavarzinella formosa]
MKLSDATALVTGGAGFIGSHLVDALLQSGARKVRILDDFTAGRNANIAHHAGDARLEVVRGDIRDRDAVVKCLAGADVVFHLACRGVRHSIGNPQENHEVNATGTLTLLEESRAAKIERFVHVSSSEVYGTALRAPMDEEHPCFPETVYGGAKLAGEAYARAFFRTYGMNTTVVRPFNNFGPRSHHEGDSGEVIPRFVVWAMNGVAPTIFGDGLQTRDFIYVADTAYWLCRVAESDALTGKTVNLGSGRETTILEIARQVLQQTGRTDLTPGFAEPRPGDVRRHLADSKLAEQTLDFRLRTSLGEGIGHLVEHFRGHPEGPVGLLRDLQSRNWK